MNSLPTDEVTPIKVLHIASGDLWAGAEAQMYSLCKALRDIPDVQLHAAILNQGTLADRLQYEGISLDVFNENELSLSAIYSGLKRLVEVVRPDVIHTHRHKENIMGSFVAWRCGGIASIRTVHGAEEHIGFSLRRLLVRGLDRFAARNWQQKIVAVSQQLKQDLSLALGRPIDFVANGIDESLFEIERPTLETKSQKLRVAFAARLVPVKRADLLLDIAQLLQERHPGQFEFHIFGDGPEFPQIAERIARHGLGGVVEMHGFIANIVEGLLETDALLITSDHEGLPMVLLEAASIGLPVIARSVGEIPAVLENGRFGTLIDDPDPACFADSFSLMLESPEPFLDRSKHAREHVLKQYSASCCARRYLSLYRQMLIR